jgi:hypothetical protein
MIALRPAFQPSGDASVGDLVHSSGIFDHLAS